MAAVLPPLACGKTLHLGSLLGIDYGYILVATAVGKETP